jgi:hypothetical protein
MFKVCLLFWKTTLVFSILVLTQIILILVKILTHFKRSFGILINIVAKLIIAEKVKIKYLCVFFWIVYRFLLRSKTLGRPAGLEKTAEKLKGLQMIVCLDCKTMVLQIIKTSRTSRSQAIKNLSLNISPVYWLETALVTLS